MASPGSRVFPHPFRLLALLPLALFFIAGAGGAIVFGILLITGDPADANRQFHGIGLLVSIGTAVIARVLIFVQGNRLRCNLCHGRPFINRRCRKHVNAARYPAMSYVASAVFDLAFRAGFTCMYCGTDFRLSFRKKKRELTVTPGSR